MTTSEAQSKPQHRYELKIIGYEKESTASEVCGLIYGNQDERLAASMLNTPYSVGKSFSRDELERLVPELKRLKAYFRFRAFPPSSEIIEFLPGATAVEVDRLNQPAPQSMTQKKYFLITAGLIALGVALVLLLNDGGQDSFEVQNLSSDAKIVSFKPSVNVRKESGLEWVNALNQMSLENGDSVRTRDGASASIEYSDGTQVWLKANSLVVIGESTQSKMNMVKRRITMDDGDLSARLESSDAQLEIASKGNFIRLQAVDRNGASLETSVRGEKLLVKVLTGEAQVESGDTKLQIQPNEKLESNAPGKLTKSKFTPSVSLEEPRTDAELLLEKDVLLFKWEDLGPASEYRFELSSDQSFQNILLVRETTEPSAQMSYLDPGELFWRVTAKSKGTNYTSEIRRLYVRKPNN